MIVLDEQHLRSVLAEFVRYYNEDRLHRTLGLQTPEAKLRPTTFTNGLPEYSIEALPSHNATPKWC